MTTKLIQQLDQLDANAKQLTADAAQATQELRNAVADMPEERLKKLVFDLECRMFGRGGISQEGRDHRELIAGVERGCK